MENHLGLVIIENDKLVAAKYYVSKFQRELGDVINYEGIKYQVGVIGTDRSSVVNYLNTIIKDQNAITRKTSKTHKAQGEQMFNNTFNQIFNNVFFK